jgi:phytoene dehydrogenase-like protein
MAEVRGVTRRTALGTLAAGLAAAACAPRARARREVFLPPAGEIVGASFAAGHRLREAPPQLPASAPRERVPVVIVGGGIAGLAAAWRLARAGVDDVVLLELEGALGGTARSGELAGQKCPWGAHYVAVPRAEQRAMVALLDELGAFEGRDAAGEPIAAEHLLVRDPEERLYYKGRWSEGLWLAAGERAEDRRQLAAFEAEVARWVAWRDARGRRAFTLPVAACSDDAEVTALDRITMAAWLDARGLGSPRLRWMVDYACRDDYGATAAQVSAWAGLFYFCARVPAPGAESAPFLTWPEGNGRLVAHLGAAAARRERRVRPGWTAAELVPRAGGGVDVVAWDPDGALVGLAADQVICAAPRFVAARLVRDWRDSPPPWLGAYRYGAWMVANLALADRPGGRGFPLAWDNVLYESESLGYVVATHQEGRERGPTVFTYYLPLADDDPAAARRRLYQGDWAHWARYTLNDLSRAHPEIARLTTRLDVMRWGHAMVRPAPGLMWGGARAAAAAPYRGIHFAGTDLSGVALFEEALDHGVRAAEEVLAARGVASPSLRGG